MFVILIVIVLFVFYLSEKFYEFFMNELINDYSDFNIKKLDHKLMLKKINFYLNITTIFFGILVGLVSATIGLI